MKKLLFMMVSLTIFLNSCVETESVSPTKKLNLKADGYHGEDLPEGHAPTAVDIMSAYSTGFQLGHGLKKSIPTVPDYLLYATSLTNNDRDSLMHPTDRKVFKTGHAIDTLQINPQHGINLVRKNEVVYIYVVSSETAANLDEQMIKFLKEYSGSGYYDTVARMAWFDGYQSDSGLDYKRQITLDGIPYTLPWPDQCPGCEPF